MYSDAVPLGLYPFHPHHTYGISIHSVPRPGLEPHVKSKDGQMDTGLGMVHAALPACRLAPCLQKLLEFYPLHVSLQDSSGCMGELHFSAPLLVLLLQHW